MNAIKSFFDMMTGETPILQIGPSLDDNNQPVDLTSATISFVIRKQSSVGPVVVSKAVGSGITIPNQGDQPGMFTVDIQSSDTANLQAGVYYYEARVTLGSVVLSVCYGNMNLIKSGV